MHKYERVCVHERERESSMSSWKTVLTGSESSVGAAWPPVWLCETLKELFTAASESELFGEDEGGTTTTSCSSVVRGEDEDSSDVLMLTEEEKGDMKKKLNSCGNCSLSPFYGNVTVWI